MSKFLKTMQKMVKNSNGSLASDGLMGDIAHHYDTGSYALNALLSGSMFKGMASNKILGLAGEEATGKTFFAMGIANQFQKAYPQGINVIYDTEFAYDSDMLSGRGLDLNRTFIEYPVTVQEFKNKALSLVDEYLKEPEEVRTEEPILFILDSLGNLSTNKEMEDSSKGEDTRDMTRAQIIKAAFRVLTLKFGMANIPMIVTNHIYQAIGGYNPGSIMGGGSGLKYAASQIIYLTKAKATGEDIGQGSAAKALRVGSLISCTAKKSRKTKENLKVKVLLTPEHGLDQYYGLLDIALDLNVVTSSGRDYAFPDGRKAFKKNILGEPDVYFSGENMDKLEIAINGAFKYGAGSSDQFEADETEEESNDE